MMTKSARKGNTENTDQSYKYVIKDRIIYAKHNVCGIMKSMVLKIEENMNETQGYQ
jgi:hypothetical protein